MPRPESHRAAPIIVVLLTWPMAGYPVNAATIEGHWIDRIGSVEVGGMQFDGASDIVDTIRETGAQCDSLTRLQTQPGSLLATCGPDGQRFRLLPDADGEPLVAPIN